MEIRETISATLKGIIKDLTGQEVTPQLEHPKEEAHGDYSSNVALVLGKETKQSPLVIAKKIAKKFSSPIIEKVDIAGPGFVNFWLSKVYLSNQLEIVLEEKEKYGQGTELKGKKIMVEFTDPNPFKEFHIGHLYSNIVGEALCRFMEAEGANVWRVNYQGDVGRHVAAAIWGMNRLRDEMPQVRSALKTKVAFMGKAYALGTASYESDEQARDQIIELNKEIYSNDPEVKELYEVGRKWSLDYFETIYKRLGTKFNHYYFESEAGKVGLEIVRDHVSDGIFEKSDGAIIFPGEKYKLHNRVFINSQGLPTYEAKELGLAPTKYKDFPYGQSIIITGNEINAYFTVILKALSLINPDLAAKTRHIGHGMVRLPTGKMSSRTGQVLTGEWLLDEAKRRIRGEYREMDGQTAEEVAVSAVKWALLKSGIGKDIAFDFDSSISLEGDSGPYVQYTFARTQSVLRKFEARSTKSETISNNQSRKSMANGKWQMENEEVKLLRALHRFPEAVEEASQRFAPNLLCHYLFNLASAFNLFYQKHPIIDPTPGSGHEEIRELRLGLTEAVGLVLKNGLRLLGIEAVVRM